MNRNSRALSEWRGRGGTKLHALLRCRGVGGKWTKKRKQKMGYMTERSGKINGNKKNIRLWKAWYTDYLASLHNIWFLNILNIGVAGMKQWWRDFEEAVVCNNNDGRSSDRSRYVEKKYSRMAFVTFLRGKKGGNRTLNSLRMSDSSPKLVLQLGFLVS